MRALRPERPWIEASRAVGKPLQVLAYSILHDIDAVRDERFWSNSDLAALQPGLAAAVRVIDGQLSLAKKAAQQIIHAKHGRKNCAGPSCVASAYAGPPLVQEAVQSGPSHDDATGSASLLPFNITCLNFGYSGGADPQGTVLALDRWRDVSLVASSLQTDLLVGTACRLLDGACLQDVLPEFPFTAMGPRSKRYDAVVGFAPCDTDAEIIWRAEWSHLSRVSWFHVLDQVVVAGFTLPPKSSATDDERAVLVRQIFIQYDFVRSTLDTSMLIVLMGDLNPTDRIEREFRDECSKRGLIQHVPSSVSTHIDGRRLDVVVSACPSLLVQVHNGRHCREHGCIRHQCGNLNNILDSKDLDHYPITVTCLGVMCVIQTSSISSC